MIINGAALWVIEPIKEMLITKESCHGVSHGLSEAGYDIRIAQEIYFKPRTHLDDSYQVTDVVSSKWTDESGKDVGIVHTGRFIIASAIEEFDMPDNLVGIVHDKSTWARRGLSVFNTVIEPGWKGFLTLELVYHGNIPLRIPAGSGIAQVVFHQTALPANYAGKYQNQENKPVEAKNSL